VKAVIERVWRCIWRPCSCNSEMHLEAVIEQVWRCTWWRSIGGTPGADTLSISYLVNSLPWECDKVTLPLGSHGELAGGGRSCSEARRKLKLH